MKLFSKEKKEKKETPPGMNSTPEDALDTLNSVGASNSSGTAGMLGSLTGAPYPWQIAPSTTGTSLSGTALTNAQAQAAAAQAQGLTGRTGSTLRELAASMQEDIDVVADLNIRNIANGMLVEIRKGRHNKRDKAYFIADLSELEGVIAAHVAAGRMLSEEDDK